MHRRALLGSLLALATHASTAATKRAAPAKAPAARTIDWLELLLPKDRAAAGPRQHPNLNGYLAQETGALAPQQGSDAVDPALDGRLVRIPGFIVPLDSDGSGRLRTFLLVPYMGACTHLPPPPPNQIVQVTLAQPVPPTSIYTGYWVTGRLAVRRSRSRYGASSWSMTGLRVEDYTF